VSGVKPTGRDARGPDLHLRGARTLTGPSDFLHLTRPNRKAVQLPLTIGIYVFHYDAYRGAGRLLAIKDDAELLPQISTSPLVESERFTPDTRHSLQFLIQNSKATAFWAQSNQQPRCWTLQLDGTWTSTSFASATSQH